MQSTVTVLVIEDIYDDGSVDPVYQAKAHVLNRALQEIGMGKYQVRILMLAIRLERHQETTPTLARHSAGVV